jgi:3-deoxy-manno-octulosonate cytidylyltransferase (CMP-KDO synthetase)
MRSAIVIPARLASQRLPRKPLLDLGGRPLIIRVAERARACSAADEVVITTDSDEIAATARAHGFMCIMTGAQPTGSDRVAEVNRELNADVVVNLQGDEPFIDPRDLTAIIRQVCDKKSDIATLRWPIGDAAEFSDPNVVKAVVGANDRALYFSRSPIPHHEDGAAIAPFVFRHIGVYGFTRASLATFHAAPVHPLERCERLEQLRALAINMTIAVLPACVGARGINTPDDLAWARQVVEHARQNQNTGQTFDGNKTA